MEKNSPPTALPVPSLRRGMIRQSRCTNTSFAINNVQFLSFPYVGPKKRHLKPQGLKFPLFAFGEDLKKCISRRIQPIQTGSGPSRVFFNRLHNLRLRHNNGNSFKSKGHERKCDAKATKPGRRIVRTCPLQFVLWPFDLHTAPKCFVYVEFNTRIHGFVFMACRRGVASGHQPPFRFCSGGTKAPPLQSGNLATHAVATARSKRMQWVFGIKW